MAYALVGSLGTASTATTGSVTPAFAQTTTAGNLLLCWAACGNNALGNTPSGWSKGFTTGNNRATVYYKIAAGSDTAPTVVCSVSGTITAAQLAEFSGNASSTPADQSGTSVSATSPTSVAAAGADVAGGELVVCSVCYFYSMAGTKTTSHAYNNGGTTLNNANNDGTSDITHYRFTYAITTGNAAADTVTDTWTITNVTAHDAGVVSFKLAAGGGGGGNPDFSPHGQTGFYGA